MRMFLSLKAICWPKDRRWPISTHAYPRAKKRCSHIARAHLTEASPWEATVCRSWERATGTTAWIVWENRGREKAYGWLGSCIAFFPILPKLPPAAESTNARKTGGCTSALGKLPSKERHGTANGTGALTSTMARLWALHRTK